MTDIYLNHDLNEHPIDFQGWNYDDNVFDVLIARIEPKVIFEIGTWKGASAIKMALACSILHLPTKIYCIDTWLGSYEHIIGAHQDWYESLRHKNGYPQLYYTFLSNVIAHQMTDYIIPMPMTSEIAAEVLLVKNIRPDMVYIDAGHSLKECQRDIELFWYTLNPGGVMLIDDYNDRNWSGVTAAVNGFDWKSEIRHNDNHKAWVFKP